MKPLHNKNIWVILILVLVIAAVLAASALLPKNVLPGGKEETLFTAAPTEQVTEAPAEQTAEVTEAPAEQTAEVTEAPTETAAPEATEAPVETAAPETTEVPAEQATEAPAETVAFEVIETPGATEAPMETAAPEATEAPAEQTAGVSTEATEAPAAESTARPARGYVLVQTATQYGFVGLPEEGEMSIPITQVMDDGTETVNVIHLTPEGVYMESSTCENQDCVGEGTVTLENKAERILGNYILCLPNRVTLQLFTPEELLAIYQGE